jgi:hypothetical protein
MDKIYSLILIWQYLWKDWDYEYFDRLVTWKLRRMSVKFWKYGCHVDSKNTAREIRKVTMLLRKLHRIPKQIMNTDAWNLWEERQYTDRKKAYKIIGEKITGWWD